MIIDKRKFIDYSVLTLFVAMSGVPAFHSNLLIVLEFSVLFLLFICFMLIIDSGIYYIYIQYNAKNYKRYHNLRSSLKELGIEMV